MFTIQFILMIMFGNMSDEENTTLTEGYRAIIKKINEYVQEIKNNDEYGYILEGSYSNDEYEEKKGYSFYIEISYCDRDYFNNHLDDVLAKNARTERVDFGPISDIDGDNFEFYEQYSEWMEDYTDDTTKHIRVYSKEDKQKDMDSIEIEL